MITELRSYPVWLNLLGYQMLWFLAVFAADKSLVVLAICLTAHLWLSPERLKEASLMLLCSTLGLCIDSTLALSGVFVFEPSVLPVPFWLLGIWLAFSATLRKGLRYFINRPPLALTAAAIGAPLAYLSAARLGAVEFPLGYTVTALIISAAWVPLMAFLIVCVRWLDARSFQ